MTDSTSKRETVEDSVGISSLKEALKRSTFHVEFRPDRIIVYQFDNLSREVLIQWVEYIRTNNDAMKPPVRILYDFRESGPPSRFLMDRLPDILADLEIADDIRSAFLVDDSLTGHFTRNALTRLPDNIGPTKSFLNLTPALKWLKEGLESVGEDDTDEDAEHEKEDVDASDTT
jgi:hypothetical protein